MTEYTISNEQFKGLKLLLKDIVDCAESNDRWIAERRKEEIEAFLEDFVK